MNLTDTVPGTILPDIISLSRIISRTIFGIFKTFHIKTLSGKNTDIHMRSYRHNHHLSAKVCFPSECQNPKKIFCFPVCKTEFYTATTVTFSLKGNLFFCFSSHGKVYFYIVFFTGKSVFPADASTSAEYWPERLICEFHFSLKGSSLFCFFRKYKLFFCFSAGKSTVNTGHDHKHSRSSQYTYKKVFSCDHCCTGNTEQP